MGVEKKEDEAQQVPQEDQSQLEEESQMEEVEYSQPVDANQASPIHEGQKSYYSPQIVSGYLHQNSFDYQFLNF